jgi:septal ring factor EnvC (AmiA/AmiB activator)
MNLDTDTIVALIGLLGVVLTTLGGVYIATKTNKSEKEDSAEVALQKTRDEAYVQQLEAKDDQIELRDDRIAALREDLVEAEQDNAKLRAALEDCQTNSRARIAELEHENDQLGLENRRLKGLSKP